MAKTSGVAYVLLPTDKTNSSKSVWTRIDKGALIAGDGACTRIITVDPNSFDKKCILWDRSGENDAKIANCLCVAALRWVDGSFSFGVGFLAFGELEEATEAASHR